jgi:hypothetical protein
MKSMKKWIGLSMAALALAGCASAPSMLKASQVGNVAIMAVTTMDSIGWYGESRNHGLVGNALKQAADAKRGEDCVALAARADASLRDAMAGKQIAVVDPSKLQQAAVYAGASEDAMTKAAGIVAGKGYRVLNFAKGDLTKKLAGEVGFSTGVTAFLDINKMMAGGVGQNGVANACVTMTVIAYDANGKAVLQKSYFGKSKTGFKVLMGAYSSEELMKACPEAIDDAVAKFAADLAN